MSLKPLKVDFYFDGSGVVWSAHEPLHLDALLAWCLAPYHCKGEPPRRGDPPTEIPLPLGRWHAGGQWGWSASSLFSDTNSERVAFWRKRMRTNRLDYANQNPNIKNGPYREYNNSMSLLLARRLTGFMFGDRKRVMHILKKHVRYIGKKRAAGYGKVQRVDCTVIDKDCSVIDRGRAMRFLPDPSGWRRCRVRPPYWNMTDVVNCCEVGDKYGMAIKI